MNSIEIHPAIPEQAGQILSVLAAAFEQYRETVIPQSSVFRETAASVRGKIDKGGGFAAWDEQKMVGIVLWQAHPDYMYLGRLGVLPEYRGQGIAHRLIDSVEQAAHAQHLSRIELGVRIALTGNQHLFQSLGYQINGYHHHEGYTEPTYVTMEKYLQS